MFFNCLSSLLDNFESYQSNQIDIHTMVLVGFVLHITFRFIICEYLQLDALLFSYEKCFNLRIPIDVIPTDKICTFVIFVQNNVCRIS